MKLYSIRDWSTIYENNRTRELKEMHWIPVPNNHHSDGYTQLITEKNGLELLGSWLIILQLASRCGNPAGGCGMVAPCRGVLKRGNGMPHDAKTIARNTRADEAAIQRALDYFSTELDWLIVNDLDESPQVGATLPQVHATIPHPHDIEGKGMEENGRDIPQSASEHKVQKKPARRVKKAIEKKAETEEYKQFVSLWHERYKAIHGVDYSMNFGKDGSCLKRFLASVLHTSTVHSLIAIAQSAWKMEKSPWIKGRAINISSFCSEFNQIKVAVSEVNPVAIDGKTNHQKALEAFGMKDDISSPAVEVPQYDEEVI